MKTIADLKKEVEIKNVSFSEISPETSGFAVGKFLNSPFCTLLLKRSDWDYIVLFQCDDRTNIVSLYNGTYEVVVVKDEDYLYSVGRVSRMKDNQIIDLSNKTNK